MTPALRAAAFALFAILSCQALAGPLRERVEARRAARQAADGASVTLLRNVSYGPGREQRFDVYLPKAAAGAPVIFMVHGGGWRYGDKGMDRVVENKVAWWTARGFIFVSSNYRMLPDADPLLQARDIALAIGAAQQQAPGWGGDANRFILMGHSAGAHLVALLSSAPQLRGPLRWLGTVALDGAGFDIEQMMQGRHMPLYDEAFGTDPAFWRAASPYAQLTQNTQPILAVCSTRRSEACEQAQRYAAKAGGMGVRVQVLPQNLSHRDINETLGQQGAYTDAVDQFIRSLL
jgi:arylformamidase